jgi:hypothetical protein
MDESMDDLMDCSRFDETKILPLKTARVDGEVTKTEVQVIDGSL